MEKDLVCQNKCFQPPQDSRPVGGSVFQCIKANIDPIIGHGPAHQIEMMLKSGILTVLHNKIQPLGIGLRINSDTKFRIFQERIRYLKHSYNSGRSAFLLCADHRPAPSLFQTGSCIKSPAEIPDSCRRSETEAQDCPAAEARRRTKCKTESRFCFINSYPAPALCDFFSFPEISTSATACRPRSVPARQA